jgi:WD repeat-containing protein 26
LVTCAYLPLGFDPALTMFCLFSESAATLEEESGYVMETSPVAEFRRCILEGAWSEAEHALERLGVAEDDGLWV